MGLKSHSRLNGKRHFTVFQYFNFFSKDGFIRPFGNYKEFSTEDDVMGI